MLNTSLIPDGIINKGMFGEAKAHHLTEGLGMGFDHNPFDDESEYRESLKHGGPDLWTLDIKVEVKYWPNSYLSKASVGSSVKPRFNPFSLIKNLVLFYDSTNDKSGWNKEAEDYLMESNIHFCPIDINWTIEKQRAEFETFWITLAMVCAIYLKLIYLAYLSCKTHSGKSSGVSSESLVKRIWSNPYSIYIKLTKIKPFMASLGTLIDSSPSLNKSKIHPYLNSGMTSLTWPIPILNRIYSYFIFEFWNYPLIEATYLYSSSSIGTLP